MATLGVVFSKPVRETTDPEWFGRCCAFINGTWMAWRKEVAGWPAEERPEMEWFGDGNLTVNAMVSMPFSQEEHRAAFRHYVEQQVQAWRKSGAPRNLRLANGPAEFCAHSGTTSGLGVDQLLSHRGNLLRPVATGAYLGNRGEPFAFELDVELDLVRELARGSQAEALVMWTWGHSLQLRLYPGQRSFSLRLSRPSDRARRKGLLSELQEALGGLKVDWKVVEAQLEAERIELKPWFQAFGLPGAAELASEDGPAHWELLDQVGGALLRAQAPESAPLKKLNAFLGRVSDQKVPAKPGKGMARKLFEIAWALRQVVGLPRQARLWKERYQAANRYWELVDSQRGEQLTVGTDKKGLGASGALGRLLTHYPEPMARDGWFWSLAAQQTEAANGHTFVAGMEALAQAAETAGCTLVVFPAAKQAAFRQAFGLEGGVPEAEAGWSAECFLDLPGLLKAEVAELAAAWLKKSKSSGLVVRAEADGTTRLIAVGEPGLSPDPKALSQAALGLSPHGLTAALGLGQLLRGAELEPARDQPETPPGELALDALPPPRPAGPEWDAVVPPSFEAPQIRWLVDPGVSDLDFLETLVTDLRGGTRCKVRRQGARLHLLAQNYLATATVAAVLGDLPPGTVLAGGGNGQKFHLILQ